MEDRVKHTRTFAGITVAVTALALTACGGETTPTQGGTDPSVPVTLTLATFLDPAGKSGREVVLKKVIDEFKTKHPNVTIQVQTSQFSLLTTQFLAGVAANNAPDISFMTNLDIVKVNSLGYFTDLSGVLKSDDASDLKSGSFNGVLVDGKPHAVPLFPIAFGYMYNKKILAANNIDPTSLTTWDAFTNAANKLGATGLGGFCQGFSESTPDNTGVEAHLLSTAKTLFNPDGSPNWDSQEGVDAVTWAKQLIASGGTPKEAVAWTTEDPYQQFAAGKCAMSMAASSRVPAAQTALGKEAVGFGLFPTRDGSAPSVNLLGGWTVGVWKGSKSTDWAGQFVASLVSADADKLWVKDAGQAPLRASTRSSVDLADWQKTVVQGIQTGYAPPSSLKADWRPAFNAIMQDVLANGTDPKAALTAGVKKYAK